MLFFHIAWFNGYLICIEIWQPLFLKLKASYIFIQILQKVGCYMASWFRIPLIQRVRFYQNIMRQNIILPILPWGKSCLIYWQYGFFIKTNILVFKYQIFFDLLTTWFLSTNICSRPQEMHYLKCYAVVTSISILSK